MGDEFPWMPIALDEMGVTETPGTGNTPRIVEYLRSTTIGAGLAGRDATPWCSAFVNWCLKRAGVQGTNSAAARSWLHWGEGIATPRRGCIVVFSRDAGGHVAFFMNATPDWILVLGGNQGDRVSIGKYASHRLLEYRVPSVAPVKHVP